MLVGDPQQLPATVLSTRAKEGLLERSLFERLQKTGHPVRMLAVQYRMHPEIRTFPSTYFYHGALQDACGPPLVPIHLCPLPSACLKSWPELEPALSHSNLPEGEGRPALLLTLPCTV